MIDIRGDSKNRVAARLSNFTERHFTFRRVKCACIEGILQSLKCQEIRMQRMLCEFDGRAAQKCGQDFNSWKKNQVLWWDGIGYIRSSHEYVHLITRVYDAVYEQDASFKEDLLALGHDEIQHSIGKSDMSDTVLTEVEMIHQLNRLRIRALAD